MSNKKYFVGVYTVLAFSVVLVAVPAFAQSQNGGYGGGYNNSNGYSQAQGGSHQYGSGNRGNRGVFGTVASIDGTTLTVISKGFGQNTATTTYTVDVSNATVMENNATSSVSNINVGDTVMVQGTVSGTNVTATTIRDGVVQKPGTMSGSQFKAGTRPVGNGGSTASGTTSSQMNNQMNSNNASSSQSQGFISSFFGSIGQFFKNLFHF